MFFLLLILAIQVGVAVGFVWLVVHFATRKTVAETKARVQDLERRIARIEQATPSGPDAQ